MNDNYRALIEHLPVTRDDLYRLSRNTFEGAWLTETEKHKHLNDLHRVFG